MRAWIETDLKPNVIGLKKVALRVRAWIETKGWYTIPSPTNVALRVRAWIETDSCTKSITYSLLNRGKLVRFVILPTNGLGGYMYCNFVVV